MRKIKPLSEVRNGGFFRCPNSSNVLKKIGTRYEYRFGRNVRLHECADGNGYVKTLPDCDVERASLDEIRVGFYNAYKSPLLWK